MSPQQFTRDLASTCDNATPWLVGWDAHVDPDIRAEATVAARMWEEWTPTIDLTIDQVNAIALAMGWPGQLTNDGVLAPTQDWPLTASCEHGTGDPGVCIWFATPGGALTHSVNGWSFYPLDSAAEFYDMPDVPSCPEPENEE